MTQRLSRNFLSATTHSWQPAVSSLLPSTKNSLLRASRQSSKPFGMALVAIGLKAVLTAPELLRSKAQPEPSRISVSRNTSLAMLQVGEAPTLLVKLLGRRSSDKSDELLISARNQALKRLAMQLLRLVGRRHPAFQGHLDGVEHPRGYAVSANVVRLQGR